VDGSDRSPRPGDGAAHGLGLNLRTLRKPCLPEDGGLAAAPETVVLSRRQFMSTASTAAMSPLLLGQWSGRPFYLRRTADGIDVVAAGAVRWRVHRSAFAGSPHLTVRDIDHRAEIRLSNARFPGTSLRADFTAVLERIGECWRLHLTFEHVGSPLQADLMPWLLGHAPAIGGRSASGLRVFNARRGAVLVDRHAVLEFTPDWHVRFTCDAGIELVVDARSFRADVLELTRPAETDPWTIRGGASGRVWLTIPRPGRPWPVVPELTSAGFRVVSADSSIDHARVEAGERHGAINAAVTFSGRAGTVFRFESSGSAHDPSSSDLPLINLRYAVPLSATRRRNIFLADFGEPAWVSVAGASLRLGATSEGRPLEILAEGDEVRAVRGAPGVYGLTVPQAEQSVQVGVVEVTGTPLWLVPPAKVGFWKRLACWLRFGDCNDLCIPVHGGIVPLSRSEDLLQLRIEFRHARFETRKGCACLTPEPGGKKPLLVVHLPPQHVLEEGFYEQALDCSGRTVAPIQEVGNCKPTPPLLPPRRPPIRALLSGSSRLVFEVGNTELPFTSSALLNWGVFDLKVSPRATAPGQASPGATPAPIDPDETLIELPTRVHLSPHGRASWILSDPKSRVNRGKWTELWHARLGTKRKKSKADTDFVVDEWNRGAATLRALWTPGYEAGCLPTHDNLPFLTTLDHRDRVEFVELTSNFKLPAKGVCPGATDREERGRAAQDYYLPKPIGTEHLLLSSMGGWLRSSGSWDPPMNDSAQALTVEHWEHRALMARDHYVKVIYRGFLVCLGVRCVLVKITERKVQDIDGHAEGPLALLRQRYQIVIRQHYKEYPALAQQFDSRGWPFRAVHFEPGYTTPVLDFPEDPSKFTPKVGCKDFLFPFQLETRDGRKIPCSASLDFIDATVAYADCSAVLKPPTAPTCSNDCPPLDGQHDDFWARYNSAANEARRRWYLHDGPVTYAPSRQRGDTQFETDYIEVRAEQPDWNTPTEIKGCNFTEPHGGASSDPQTDNNKAKLCLALFRDTQAPVYPRMFRANVRIPAIEQLTRSRQYTHIRLHDLFVQRGFSEGHNPGEIFAQFEKAVPLIFSGRAESGDKAGGVVSPNADLIGLSRRTGPVGGSGAPERFAQSLEVTASGNFDSKEYFNATSNSAMLLGGIRLVDVLPGLGSLGEAPKIVRRILGLELTMFRQAVTTLLTQVLEPPTSPINEVQYLKTRIEADVAFVRRAIDELPAQLPPEETAAAMAEAFSILQQQQAIVAALRRIAQIVETGLSEPGLILEEQLAPWRLLFDGIIVEWTNQLNALKALLPTDPEQAVVGLAARLLEQVFGPQWLDELITARIRLEATLKGLIGSQVDKLIPILQFATDALRAIEDVRERVRRITDGLALVQAQSGNIEAAVRTFVHVFVPPQMYLDERAKLEKLTEEVLSGIAAGADRENLKRAYLTLRDLQVDLEVEVPKLQPSTDPAVMTAAFRALQRIQARLVLAIAELNRVLTEIQSRVQVSPLAEWSRELGSLARPTANPQQAAQDLRQLIQEWITRFTSVTVVNDAQVDALRRALVFVDATADDSRRVAARADALVTLAKRLTGAAASPSLNNAREVAALLEAGADFVDLFGDSLVALKAAPPGSTERQQLMAVANALRQYGLQLESGVRAVEIMVGRARTMIDNAPAAVRAQLSRKLGEAVVEFERLRLDQAARLVFERTLIVLGQTLQNLRTLHDELLTTLRPTLDEALAILSAKEEIERRLVDLLKPLQIELSYTWTPTIKAGPGSSAMFEPLDTKGLTIESRLVSRVDPMSASVSAPEVSIVGRLVNFKIHLLAKSEADNYISIQFRSLVFRSRSGSGPTCDVEIGDVKLGKCLEFVSKLAEWLSGDEGFFLEIGASEIVTGFRFASPYIPLGGLIFQNVRFEAGFRLRYNGDPFRVVFALSSKRNPFELSVGIYGGTGFVNMTLGPDGVEGFTLGLGFGLVGGVRFGPVVGKGRLVAGIAIERVKVGIELTGFVETAGQLSLIGMSISAYGYLGLRWNPSTDLCEGQVIVEITISLFMFDVTFRFEVRKQFSGQQAGSGQTLDARQQALRQRTVNLQGSTSIAQDDEELATPIDWDDYFEAFAA
jgi:hypothetical protein